MKQMGNREAEDSKFKSEGRIYRLSIWETKGHKKQETAKRIRAIAAFFFFKLQGNFLFSMQGEITLQKRQQCKSNIFDVCPLKTARW